MKAGKVLGAALTVGSSMVGVRAAEASPAETHQTVAIGDSVGKMIFQHLAGDVWIDADAGRQPNYPGEENRGTTLEALAAAIPFSKPGGDVILQDWGSRSLDTDPDTPDPQTIGVTYEEWRAFVQEAVEIVPDDRWLIWILPAYDPRLNPAGHEESVRRSEIVEEELEDEPRSSLVNWNEVLMHTPGLTDEIGLHPNGQGLPELVELIEQARQEITDLPTN